MGWLTNTIVTNCNKSNIIIYFENNNEQFNPYTIVINNCITNFIKKYPNKKFNNITILNYITNTNNCLYTCRTHSNKHYIFKKVLNIIPINQTIYVSKLNKSVFETYILNRSYSIKFNIPINITNEDNFIIIYNNYINTQFGGSLENITLEKNQKEVFIYILDINDYISLNIPKIIKNDDLSFIFPSFHEYD